MKKNIALVLAVVMVLSLFAGCSGDQMPPLLSTYTKGGSTSSTGAATGSSGSVIRNDGASEAADEWAIAEEYVIIELGMTLAEVQEIIGSEGSGKKQGKFMFYTWTGFGALGNIVVMAFKDDVLTNKDPQERNVTGTLPSLEDALAYFEALGLSDVVEDAQETAEENQEELGLEAPAEEEAPAEGETTEVPEGEAEETPEG